MAFNFESNYGLPSNESYNQWIDRWDLDEQFVGLNSDVTPIDGREALEVKQEARRALGPPRFTRHDFYRAIVNYMGQYGYNGSACLLRCICEISAAPLDAHNGVLGSIFKILFMPTTSAAERRLQHMHSLYEASELGTRGSDSHSDSQSDAHCADYVDACPHSMLDMISVLL
ncbi:CG14115 [Drosophila busckii]|uniref:CG14115 n=1 Tax=Drosophila busckii TaxID=30019 RepID=A0A0M3QWQ5_DROBS|nr:CG14115 [Drosophila busckii]